MAGAALHMPAIMNPPYCIRCRRTGLHATCEGHLPLCLAHNHGRQSWPIVMVMYTHDNQEAETEAAVSTTFCASLTGSSSQYGIQASVVL